MSSFLVDIEELIAELAESNTFAERVRPLIKTEVKIRLEPEIRALVAGMVKEAFLEQMNARIRQVALAQFEALLHKGKESALKEGEAIMAALRDSASR